MEDFRNKNIKLQDREKEQGRPPGQDEYPESIEQMSEKWREIRQEGATANKGSFIERNYLSLGVGIAILIIALLTVIGGFAFLVLNAR